jgi:hypothetical protein
VASGTPGGIRLSRSNSSVRWAAIALGPWLVGCDEPLICSKAACGGPPVPLALVDESDQGVAAKGEYRNNQGLLQPQPFHCTLAPDTTSPFPVCDGNLLRLDAGNLQPGATYEIRFEAENGAWSEWLPVPLQLTKHTDPDFNGPGCECTWYTGQAQTLVVPAAARRTPALVVARGPDAEAASAASMGPPFSNVVPNGGKVTTTLGPFLNAHSSRPIMRIFEAPDGEVAARIYLSHQVINGAYDMLDFNLDVIDVAPRFALAEHGYLSLGKLSDRAFETYATAGTVSISAEREGALRISLQGIDMGHLENDAGTITPRPSLGDGLVVGEVLTLCILNGSAASRAWALEHCPADAELRFRPPAQLATPAP